MTKFPKIISLNIFTILIFNVYTNGSFKTSHDKFDSKTFLLPTKYGKINLYIGEKKLKSTAYIDFYTSDLIIYDSNCGKQINCPLYCKNEIFNEIYCSLLCNKKLSTLDSNMFCPLNMQNPRNMFDPYSTFYYPYEANNSETFFHEYNFIEWTNNFAAPDKKKFVGQWGRESIYFNDKISADGIYFIRGYLLDPKYFYKANVTVGFGPSSNNLFHQLYKKGKLKEPIISSSNLNEFQIGGLINAPYCYNWTHHYASARDNVWTVQAQKVYLFGFSYSNIEIFVDINFAGILLPFRIRKHLVDKGILIYNESLLKYSNSEYKNFYQLPSYQEYNFSLEVDRNVIHLKPMISHLVEEVFLTNFRRPFEEERYSDGSLIMLNRDIYNTMCFAFNFQTRKIGLAKRDLNH